MRKITKRQKIKGSVLIGLYLLFLIWVQSWLGLIVVPFLIDIYFTKYIPWGFWRKFSNPLVKTLFSWLDAIVFALIAVYFVNTFIFQNYQIPTSSLEKSLLVGDHLFVSKLSYGPRIPNTPIALPITHNTMPNGVTKSYLDKPYWDYKRVKGFGTIKHNDIVVFNYPGGDTITPLNPTQDYYRIVYELGYEAVKNNPNLESLTPLEKRAYFNNIYQIGRQRVLTFGNLQSRPVDRRDNYVKRCLGLPGDTLQIKKGLVYINGDLNPNASEVQFNYYVQAKGVSIPQDLFKKIGLNKDDQAIYTRDLRVYDKQLNNQLIYQLSGASNQDLETVKNTYSNPNRYAIFLTNAAEGNFLEAQGFDPIGFKGDNKIIYHIPLTSKMYQVLAKDTNLVSKIVQEPETKDITDIKHLNALIYPLNGDTHWDKNEYGPIWIPKKGETIHLTMDNLPLYERCIKVYENNKLEVNSEGIFINGLKTDNYTFKMDYYWMMGDNRDNSLDSRYWGFVPEDHIVGKPLFIWLSLEKDNEWFKGRIRWNRFFKSAN